MRRDQRLRLVQGRHRGDPVRIRSGRCGPPGASPLVSRNTAFSLTPCRSGPNYSDHSARPGWARQRQGGLAWADGRGPGDGRHRSVEPRAAEVKASQRLSLLGVHEIDFDRPGSGHASAAEPAVPPQRDDPHALDGAGREIASRTYYLVGGGFVVDEAAAGADRTTPDDTPVTYPFRTGVELLADARGDRSADPRPQLATRRRGARRIDARRPAADLAGHAGLLRARHAPATAPCPGVSRSGGARPICAVAWSRTWTRRTRCG